MRCTTTRKHTQAHSGRVFFLLFLKGDKLFLNWRSVEGDAVSAQHPGSASSTSWAPTPK